jgi:drug/metabolite transporter (DMT)-like permease
MKADRLRRADTRGLWLMVASAAAFAAMAPFTRKWLLAIEPQSIIAARAVVMTALFFAWGRLRGIDLAGRDRPGLLLRGVIGWLSISCYVWSTQHLPSGQAVLIQYSHPVFVAAIAPWLLRERPGPGHWPLVLAACAGLAAVIGVGGEVDRNAAIGLCGALCTGLAYLTVRRISATEAPVTIVFWFSLVMLPTSLLSCFTPWSLLDTLAGWIGGATAEPVARGLRLLPASAGEWTGYLGVVAAGLVGQVTLTEGLKRAGAARATAVTMSGPLFGLLFDQLFFARTPTPLVLGGTLLVVAALVLLGLLKPTAMTAPAPAKEPKSSGAASSTPPADVSPE